MTITKACMDELARVRKELDKCRQEGRTMMILLEEVIDDNLALGYTDSQTLSNIERTISVYYGDNNE